MEKWRDIVSKLISKAENPATSNEERETINGKVSYLMLKYGIEQAMLDLQDKKEPAKIRHARYQMKSPYLAKKQNLFFGIASAFGVRTVRSNGVLHLFGYEDDVEKVYMLYNMLLLQMINGVALAEKPDHIHGKSFNASWIDGFVYMVVDRVRDSARRAKEDVRHTYGTSMDVALRDRAGLVNVEVRKIFPSLRPTGGSTSTSSAGYNAGRAAGSHADIGNARISGARGAIGN